MHGKNARKRQERKEILNKIRKDISNKKTKKGCIWQKNYEIQPKNY